MTGKPQMAGESRYEFGRVWQVSGYAAARALIDASALEADQGEANDEMRASRAAARDALIRVWRHDEQRVREVAARVAAEVVAAAGRDGGPCNVKWNVTRPVADRMFAEVMGLPPDEMGKVRDFFQHNLSDDPYHSAMGLRGLASLLNARIAGPRGDDLLSHLLDELGTDLRRPLLVGAVAWVFLGLGWDVAHPVVSTGALQLLLDPDQRAAACAGPDELARAIDEAFRMADPSPTMKMTDTVEGGGEPFRVVREVRLDDVAVVEPGDQVYLNLGRANRDPEVFSEPDTFRWDRDEPRIAWERPGELYPALVLCRPQADAVLRALFLGGRRFELDGEQQAELLNRPRAIRGPGVHLRFR